MPEYRRLFHKAYSINNFLDNAAILTRVGKWSKIITCLNEALRLAPKKHAINSGVRLEALISRSKAYFQVGVSSPHFPCGAIK